MSVTEKIRIEVDDAALDEALAKTEALLAKTQGAAGVRMPGVGRATPGTRMPGGDYGAFSAEEMLAFYQITSVPGMIERFARGQPTRYDILRAGRWTAKFIPQIKPLLGPLIFGAYVLEMTNLIMEPFRELEREQQRPATLSEAIRKRESDRERFRAWFP